MIFRQIVFYALMVGILSGLVLTVVQTWQVVPIIHAAEEFESQAELLPPVLASGEDHSHAADEWAPDDGMERALFTLLSNVLTAMGFGLVLMAVMIGSLQLPGRAEAHFGWQQGLLWGLSGYVTFWLAPAIGLPPEIPLQTAAPLEHRQIWWVVAVLMTAAGLTVLAFVKAHWRWAGLLLAVIPHLIGAPHPEGAMFAGQTPAVAAQLEELSRQFIGATAIANGALWLVLGLTAAWSVKRINASVRKAEAAEQAEAGSESV